MLLLQRLEMITDLERQRSLIQGPAPSDSGNAIDKPANGTAALLRAATEQGGLWLSALG